MRFTDGKLWFFSLSLARSLAEFDDIENLDAERNNLKDEFWSGSVIPIRRDLRVFTLYKGAADEFGTSLRHTGLGSTFEVVSAGRSGELTFKLRVTNSGVATRSPSGRTPGAVNSGLMLAWP